VSLASLLNCSPIVISFSPPTRGSLQSMFEASTSGIPAAFASSKEVLASLQLMPCVTIIVGVEVAVDDFRLPAEGLGGFEEGFGRMAQPGASCPQETQITSLPVHSYRGRLPCTHRPRGRLAGQASLSRV
jgi:hypothetical protein